MFFVNANWPIVKYSNGTVGVKNDGGTVKVQSSYLVVDGNMNITGELFIQNTNLMPPKCMPPGGDRLMFDGENWSCVCVSNMWSGSSCDIRIKFTPIPDENFSEFVKACLAEAPNTGECDVWASDNNYGTIPNWDVSMVTDMTFPFGAEFGEENDSVFNADISNWNTSSVKNMERMFFRAATFNQDIGRWDTSSVENMNNMFYEAISFNQDIGSWDVSKVIYMRYMFTGASSFSADISSWTGTAATTAQVEMFKGATAFQDKFECTDTITGPASSCVLK